MTARSSTSRAAPRFQARMVAACETWLAWCAAHGRDPLAGNPDEVRTAATDLRAAGANETQVLDLVDQVGAMTGQTGTLRWVHLRRTI